MISPTDYRLQMHLQLDYTLKYPSLLPLSFSAGKTWTNTLTRLAEVFL